MCVARQVEYCLRVCERIWVMARAELGRTTGLPHFSQKRSGGDKLTPHPPCWRGEGGGGGDKSLFPNATAEAGASPGGCFELMLTICSAWENYRRGRVSRETKG